MRETIKEINEIIKRYDDNYFKRYDDDNYFNNNNIDVIDDKNDFDRLVFLVKKLYL